MLLIILADTAFIRFWESNDMSLLVSVEANFSSLKVQVGTLDDKANESKSLAENSSDLTIVMKKPLLLYLTSFVPDFSDTPLILVID